MMWLSIVQKKDDTAIEQVDSITHEKIVVKKVFIKEDEVSMHENLSAR